MVLLLKLIVFGIPAVLAVTVHEVAHGWVARSFGDRTAEAQGRLSLNPIRHIDPIGTVLVPAMLLMFGGFFFGWAKPVPVNPRNLRNPRPNMAVVSVAGPSANFAMAIAWTIIIMLSRQLGDGPLVLWLFLMGVYGIQFNLSLALLNLLPIPPLDGGQALENLLPRGPMVTLLETIRPFGFLIVLAMIPTGILAAILGPPLAYLQGLFFAVAGVPVG